MKKFATVALNTTAIQEIQFEVRTDVPENFDQMSDAAKLEWLKENSSRRETFYYEPDSITSIKKVTLD